jgi:hypothetical protein
MLRYLTADALQYYGVLVGLHFRGGRARPTRNKDEGDAQLDELRDTVGRHTPGVTVFTLFGHKDLASGAEGPMTDLLCPAKPRTTRRGVARRL